MNLNNAWTFYFCWPNPWKYWTASAELLANSENSFHLNRSFSIFFGAACNCSW